MIEIFRIGLCLISAALLALFVSAAEFITNEREIKEVKERPFYIVKNLKEYL